MLIEIAEITADSLVQPRETLNKEKLTEYGKILLNGEDLDPVALYYDGSINWLADGFHRLEVYRLAGKTHIPATVTEGTRRDAILYGIERNVKHGLGLTLRERKIAARKLLLDSEWSLWSNRLIGRICGLNHETINAIKKNLNSHQSIPVENPHGENRQLQNFTNASENAIKKNLNSHQSIPVENPHGENRQLQNFTNASENAIKKNLNSHQSIPVENPHGENRQLQNFTNASDLDLDSENPELLESVSGEFPKIQNFIDTSDNQVSLCKALRNGREYTINTSKIGRNAHRTNTPNPKNQTVDISSTTHTVYDFLPPSSLPNTFKVLDAECQNFMILDDKLEMSLKLLITGPAHAFPIILKHLIQTPGFADFMFFQAQRLEDQVSA